MNDVIIRGEGLHKLYQGPARKTVRAIDGVDIAIERGGSVAIVGPSGAGKSTLLHLIAGLDRPTSGRVLLSGKDIYAMSDRERALSRGERIGLVFQFYHLLPEFTALENVMMPALMRVKGSAFAKASADRQGSRVREIKRRARELLGLSGLDHRANHRPGELSGGESQRIAIARALINEPELLLCDEPTGNLDSKTSGSIYEVLFDLKTKIGMTLVIVTHDEKISSRIRSVIRLKDGKIVQ
ncbi:MAG: ABC transporter ATP-binding protein [Candidatus Omnitrophota bacterium]